MITIRSTEELLRAIASLPPPLQSLLTFRHKQLTADGLDEIGDIARYVIAEPGDALYAIESEAGVPIVTNMVDGARFPDPAFEPNWEHCSRHAGALWEAVFILSDSGEGTVLIVMDEAGVDSTLLALCRTYSMTDGHHS
jgi:hypothetical protein